MISPSVGRQVGVAVAILVVALSGAVAARPADACSCAFPSYGKIVLTGTSEGDVRWQISAFGKRRSLLIEYLIDLTGDADGGFSQLPKPIPHRFLLDASTGSGWGSENESDLMGETAKRVHRLQVEMNDGSNINVVPTRPSRNLREKHRWARELRFFALFHPGTVRPRVVKAFGRDGALLDTVGRFCGGFFSDG